MALILFVSCVPVLCARRRCPHFRHGVDLGFLHVIWVSGLPNRCGLVVFAGWAACGLVACFALDFLVAGVLSFRARTPVDDSVRLVFVVLWRCLEAARTATCAKANRVGLGEVAQNKHGWTKDQERGGKCLCSLESPVRRF